MLAISMDEIDESPRSRTGRYVIWLNGSTVLPAWESLVWYEWLSEQDAAALFADHGLPFPHRGVWQLGPRNVAPSLLLLIALGICLSIWGLVRLLFRWWELRSTRGLQPTSHRQLHRSLTSILEQARAFLTAADLANAQELIYHGEFGPALELICTQLQEHGAPLPVSLLSRIQHAAAQLQLPACTWGGLAAQPAAPTPTPLA